jgi:hypothetical protein
VAFISSLSASVSLGQDGGEKSKKDVGMGARGTEVGWKGVNAPGKGAKRVLADGVILLKEVYEGEKGNDAPAGKKPSVTT